MPGVNPMRRATATGPVIWPLLERVVVKFIAALVYHKADKKASRKEDWSAGRAKWFVSGTIDPGLSVWSRPTWRWWNQWSGTTDALADLFPQLGRRRDRHAVAIQVGGQ